MNLGQQQQQQQQRRQHAVHGKVAETFQENHDFLLKIFLGYRMGMRTSSRGKHGWQRRGEGGDSGSCCKLCGRFRFGFGIDFAACRGHFHKFRIVYLYDSCAQFSIESEEFAWRDLPEIYRRFID